MRRVIKEDFMDAVLLPHQLHMVRMSQIGGLEGEFLTPKQHRHLEPMPGDEDA